MEGLLEKDGLLAFHKDPERFTCIESYAILLYIYFYTSPDMSKSRKLKKSPDARSDQSKRKLNKKSYFSELERLQLELVKLHEWVKAKNLRVVVVFEGRDAAGKGGVIKRITQRLNPRICRVVALGVPTEREKTQWYFQRYVAHLPAEGEIVLFDRSWYNRAGVEHVMGFCTEEEYWDFLRSCPRFEEMLIHSGIILIKYWFSVSDEEQENRFRERIEDPLKRWKFSEMDLESRSLWIEYSSLRVKEDLVETILSSPLGISLCLFL